MGTLRSVVVATTANITAAEIRCTLSQEYPKFAPLRRADIVRAQAERG